MHAAGWFPADPITLKSSIEIVGSVLLDRPYKDAPVSNLYYLGRREDLAFEKPIGASADRRNHVRFWKVLDKGRGEASGVARRGDDGSRRRRQPLHRRHHPPHRRRHRPERERLTADLETAGMVTAKYQVTGVGPTLAGRNGGGDLYYTDGEVVGPAPGRGVQEARRPRWTILPSPLATEIKDQIWRQIAETIGK